MNKEIKLLIVDLECTCNDSPPLTRSEVEIIEIGAVIGRLGNNSFEIMSQIQLYVRPIYHPQLTPFCTNLTGIKQSLVSSAPTLVTAYEELSAWLSNYTPDAWSSWGKFDATQFEMETGLKQLCNPLAQYNHLNIKQLFARKRGHRVGLGKAIELSGLTFLGRPHSGLDDAKNIANLINHDPLLRGAIQVRTEVDK
ncbi:MAG TPA: 3'-5' exonuclease [Cellvibrio sp.]|nr:3'-5' exonuclease [Cellvibrio sp.]